MNETEKAVALLEAIRALAQVKTNSDTNAKTIWAIKRVAEAGIEVFTQNTNTPPAA